EKGAPPRDRSRRRGPAALTVPDAASLLTTHADGTTRHWLPTLNSWGSGTSGRRPGGAEQGPSPRAWGSRRSAAVALLSTGSIPTCVGFTMNGSPFRTANSVHPHVRGVHRRRPP